MLQLAAFVPVFAAGLAHWAFLFRVRQLIAERHPETWRSMRESRWGTISAAQRFAWTSQALNADDPELTRNAKGLRWSYVATVISVAVYAVVLISAR